MARINDYTLRDSAALQDADNFGVDTTGGFFRTRLQDIVAYALPEIFPERTEFRFEHIATFPQPSIFAYKVNDDALRMGLDFFNPLSTATSLTITLPSSSLIANSAGGGVSYTLDNTETISNLTVGRRFVYFQLNKVGAFASFTVNSQLIWFRCSGSGGKIVLS